MVTWVIWLVFWYFWASVSLPRAIKILTPNMTGAWLHLFDNPLLITSLQIFWQFCLTFCCLWRKRGLKLELASIKISDRAHPIHQDVCRFNNRKLCRRSSLLLEQSMKEVGDGSVVGSLSRSKLGPLECTVDSWRAGQTSLGSFQHGFRGVM